MSEIKNKPGIAAIYLPQFYETEYNNRWWGKGYTEWKACKAAKPTFAGHYQPRVPAEGWYYDLTHKEDIRRQMELAREYGVDAFGIYQYYSCGKKLLEVPTEIIRDDPSLDLPFFLYWVNESWKKAWFGQDKGVVWEQQYGSEEDWRRHFLYCLPYFKDERYLCLEGKPVYGIYNMNQIPDDRMLDCWQEWAREEGFPGIFFLNTWTHLNSEPRGKASGTWIKEPNYSFTHDERRVDRLKRVIQSCLKDFVNRHCHSGKKEGHIMHQADYDILWNRALHRKWEDAGTIPGAFCDWDNTPRQRTNAVVTKGVTVEKFEKYMKQLLKRAKANGSPFVLINAWNEWGEGAYLEPDMGRGDGFLAAIREAKKGL